MPAQTTDTVTLILDNLRRCLDVPHDRGRTQPAAFYTAPEWLDVENEAVFMREWVCLGRVDEIPEPGDYFTAEVAGEPLLVVRDEAGTINILSNVCRHRGMLLASQAGHATQLRCPYHAWRYDLRGQLLRAPLIDPRPDFSPRDCRLPTFASEIWQGFICVNLDGQAAPLAPRLGGLDAIIANYHMSEMSLRYTAADVWDCNWKCLTENFMEGYHLSTVHFDTLHPITPTRLCQHFPAGGAYLGYFSNFPDGLEQRGYYHPDLTEQERSRSVMFAVLPGLVAGLAGHMVAYICLQPATAGSVRAKLGLAFADADVADHDRNQAVDLFERTMAEDKVQLLNLQRGLASRYHTTAPLASADYEGTVWDFYQYLARCLTAEEKIQQRI